jgi:succinyldiaminopimelate transaminase
VTRALPGGPWDSLAEAKARAQAHPDGAVDLSIGTPVDPVPQLIQEALASASAVPGYPTTHGTPSLREAAVAALERRHGVSGLPAEAVLPTIGSKEFVAWLPTLLGLGADDLVVIPSLAYPTYEIGVQLAGARLQRADGTVALGPARPAMMWLNSPSNPTGQVLPARHLRKVVDWARERGTVLVSDECYLTLGWESEPVSILHPDVRGDSFGGLLAVHSLSKSSSLAGYRAGYVAGDPSLVERLLAIRRQAGMIVPHPVQSAMTAALRDDEHVAAQRARFAARRDVLRSALAGAGFRIDHSTAGMYLWATRDEPAWETVTWFAERGVVVAPGTFYGPTGDRHVRVALTAPDERVAAVAARLAG